MDESRNFIHSYKEYNYIQKFKTHVLFIWMNKIPAFHAFIHVIIQKSKPCLEKGLKLFWT